MRPKTYLAEKALWRAYYRPFQSAGLLFGALVLLLGGYMAACDWLSWKEWGSMAIREEEAVCLRADLRVGKNATGWWNTFLLEGKEHTSWRDRDGCIAGRRYWLRCRIGRTGRLQIILGTLIAAK
jgi:hypothetical protein